MLVAQTTSSAPVPPPQPLASIDLTPTGYRAPSRMDRLAEDGPSISLDFVDATHVLVSFNPKKLFHRAPECTPDHQDRLMHAVILEIPSGKVVTEADWYLHDRNRYLWPLAPGKFLLRKLNSLYTIDSNLHERLLLTSPKKLLWVSVTADGSQIIVETENDKKAPEPKRAKAAPKYVVRFLDAKTLATQRTLLFNNLTNVTGTSSGYADVIRKNDIWLVRFGPTVAQRHNLARVRSQTVPSVLFPTDNTMLVGRCAASGCNYGVTAFTLSGHRLWRDHWPALRSYPEIVRSHDNSRFGVSTVRVERAADQTPKTDEADDNPFELQISDREVVRQEVQVFDTATGTPVLAVSLSPAVTTGQNLSLSPDGGRLGLLRGSAFELYDLPPLSDDERAKFASLKADLTGVFALGSNDGPEVPAENPAPAPDFDEAVSLTADAPAEAMAEKKPEAQPIAPDSTAEPSASALPPPAGSTATNKTSESAAKRGPAESAPIATIKVSTRAVVVDVVVTDSKGHPIRGLHPEDFHLTEDNQPQNVRYFREYSELADPPAQPSGGSSTAASAIPTAASQPEIPAAHTPSPNAFNNHVSESQSGAVTMVLFDMLNTAAADQQYARQQLIKFLQSKPKMSRFALCTLSSGDHPLRLIQGFTADETLLLAAAQSKKNQTKANRWQGGQNETQNSLAYVNSIAVGEGRTSGFGNLVGVLQSLQAEQQVSDAGERAGRTIDAMMLLARYLSGIAGRKNIVWLSSSFPVAMALSPLSNNPAVDNLNFTYKIKRATNLLADSQIAVYPVDVRGLQVLGAGVDNPMIQAGNTSMDAPGPSMGRNATGSANSPQQGIPQGMMDFSQMAAENDTMTQFASATGGKAFLNTNGISEAIATANEQGSNYYSFSYTPTNKIYNGKFRKIKVQLGEKGYKLFYRQGYYADDINVGAREAELARNAVATAMHFGSPPAREVQFSVKVYPLGSKKKIDRANIGEVRMAAKKTPQSPPAAQVEVQHYLIDYSVEGSQLRFVPQQNSDFRNTLALLVTSFGQEGRMLTGVTNRATSDLPPEVYKKTITGEVGLRQEVDIPVEAISMRLGIQDQMSSHLGTVDVPLPVPPDPKVHYAVREPLPEIEPD